MSEPDVSDAAPSQPAPRYALLLDSDLFFAVKVSAMLKRIGFETTTVRRTPEWAQRVAEGRYSVALVNTAAPGAGWREAITAAHVAGLPVIAYGSHVDVETQAEARAAGATRVIANSKLAADLPSIVEQTLRRAGGA
ncbi:MAG TPA: response regulator [Ktedonobacterales bacterium]